MRRMIQFRGPYLKSLLSPFLLLNFIITLFLAEGRAGQACESAKIVKYVLSPAK